MRTQREPFAIALGNLRTHEPESYRTDGRTTGRTDVRRTRSPSARSLLFPFLSHPLLFSSSLLPPLSSVLPPPFFLLPPSSCLLALPWSGSQLPGHRSQVPAPRSHVPGPSSHLQKSHILLQKRKPAIVASVTRRPHGLLISAAPETRRQRRFLEPKQGGIFNTKQVLAPSWCFRRKKSGDHGHFFDTFVRKAKTVYTPDPSPIRHRSVKHPSSIRQASGPRNPST